jgi:hypothetical protein
MNGACSEALSHSTKNRSRSCAFQYGRLACLWLRLACGLSPHGYTRTPAVFPEPDQKVKVTAAV